MRQGAGAAISGCGAGRGATQGVDAEFACDADRSRTWRHQVQACRVIDSLDAASCITATHKKAEPCRQGSA